MNLNPLFLSLSRQAGGGGRPPQRHGTVRVERAVPVRGVRRPPARRLLAEERPLPAPRGTRQLPRAGLRGPEAGRRGTGRRRPLPLHRTERQGDGLLAAGQAQGGR